MESKGLCNQIHVSATTAESLIAFGYRHWLTERADKVNVHGLREVQTYWCFMNHEDGEEEVQFLSPRRGAYDNTLTCQTTE
jgi:hypothetical protein